MNVRALFQRKPVQTPLTTPITTWEYTPTNTAAQLRGEQGAQERTFTEKEFSNIVNIATRMEIDAEKAMELEQRLVTNERTTLAIEQAGTLHAVKEGEAYRILDELGLGKYASAAIDTATLARSRVDEISALLDAKNSPAAVDRNVKARQRRASEPEVRVLEAYLSDVRRAIARSHPNMVAFIEPYKNDGSYHFKCVFADPNTEATTNITYARSNRLSYEGKAHPGPKTGTLQEYLVDCTTDSTTENKKNAQPNNDLPETMKTEYINEIGSYYPWQDGTPSTDIKVKSSVMLKDGEQLSFDAPMTIRIGKKMFTSAKDYTPQIEHIAEIVFNDPTFFVNVAPALKLLELQYRNEHPGLLSENWSYVKNFCEEDL